MGARRTDTSKLSVSLDGRVLGEPQATVVAGDEMWVFRLAVARCLDDLAAGTFAVDVFLDGITARGVAGRLTTGCQVWVTGCLDVGLGPVAGGGPRWGLQLAAEQVTVVEIDLAGPGRALDGRLLEGAA